MSQAVVFRQAARVEFDEAADWYEQRRSGLGALFVEAVQVELDRIAAQPELFSLVYRDIREALVSRFPYCIYFRQEPGSVVVMAVFHTARNPAIWQNRA